MERTLICGGTGGVGRVVIVSPAASRIIGVDGGRAMLRAEG